VFDEDRASGARLCTGPAPAPTGNVDAEEAHRCEMSDVLATRTVVIHFLPDGETQYWLTDKAFSVGETIEREGLAWTVSNVAESRETGRKPRVTLTRAKEQLPPIDLEALDRVAWNLPFTAA
jgi:hypothetical protein